MRTHELSIRLLFIQKKTNDWCALPSHGIIGPVFIHENISTENDIKTIKENLFSLFHGFDVDLNDLCLCKTDETSSKREVFETLIEHFEQKIIALDSAHFVGEGIDWPAC